MHSQFRVKFMIQFNIVKYIEITGNVLIWCNGWMVAWSLNLQEFRKPLTNVML